MEKTTIFSLGKYISVIVMLLTGITTIITTLNGYLSQEKWGVVIVSLGAFLISLRNYLKDTYGMM